MNPRITRRKFLQQATAAAGAVVSAPFIGRGAGSPNERLNLGIIGVGNRGEQNLKNLRGENIVALCDIDALFLDAAKRDLPETRLFTDFRKMLELKSIDAVVISTADHTHAVAAIAALESDRHVYCEKPLTHTISEARAVAEAARQRPHLATQTGMQIHASNNYRRIVEMVQAGTIGPVREVHCWADYRWEPMKLPEPEPVPHHINYDLWLGPVEYRPYSPEYLPFKWRRWWHFGGGTLEDFCCHLMDLPFWALDLNTPLSVKAEGPPPRPNSVPPWLIVRYQFASRWRQPPVKLTWYSGGRRPPLELPRWGNGILFVGDKGMLLANYERFVLLPENEFKDFDLPKQKILSSAGHHEEWLRACKTGSPTSCNFAYGALVTEAGLLGNVAFRTGCRLEWDAVKMKARNCPAADKFIHHHYRKGWSL